MKLAVSNIAWTAMLTLDAYRILAEANIGGLEIAPGVLFPQCQNPRIPDNDTLAAEVERMHEYGLAPISMQSLLFGATDAQLFGSPPAREQFMKAIFDAIRLAERMGISNLVLGSPKNRSIPPALEHCEAWTLAAEVFSLLGDYAKERGCWIALEPLPPGYGTNFLNNIEEALNFINFVGNSAITLNFDIGATRLSNTLMEVEEMLSHSRSRISHIHMSEPYLAPVGSDKQEVRDRFEMLRRAGWKGYVSIEMRCKAMDMALENLRCAVLNCSQAMT
ncbi:sugar phosphate isomerase/epimerase (plasmid) [Mesorhizobium loti]|nr:sugar phosphate isomerase/epimerase [Mesorhizobium loti]